jgi:glycosyl transferase family 25
MIFDRFDLIRIVNLPERKDRKRAMLNELRRMGLENSPRVQFFDAVRPDDAGDFYSKGARGCFLSHCALLREAVAKNASVLIVEDDCYFDPRVTTYELPEQWDIFYGGYDAVTPENLHTSDIVGSHVMGFSAAGAANILDYFDNLKFEGKHPPIDGAYVWFRRAYPDTPTAFAYPPIGHQRPSRSDIAANRIFDRIPGIRWLVERTREMRGAAKRGKFT